MPGLGERRLSLPLRPPTKELQEAFRVVSLPGLEDVGVLRMEEFGVVVEVDAPNFSI